MIHSTECVQINSKICTNVFQIGSAIPLIAVHTVYAVCPAAKLYKKAIHNLEMYVCMHTRIRTYSTYDSQLCVYVSVRSACACICLCEYQQTTIHVGI